MFVFFHMFSSIWSSQESGPVHAVHAPKNARERFLTTPLKETPGAKDCMEWLTSTSVLLPKSRKYLLSRNPEKKCVMICFSNSQCQWPVGLRNMFYENSACSVQFIPNAAHQILQKSLSGAGAVGWIFCQLCHPQRTWWTSGTLRCSGTPVTSPKTYMTLKNHYFQ